MENKAASVEDLCRAVRAGDTVHMSELLRRGADVNGVTGEWRETPAHQAAEKGKTGALQLLIDAGADVSLTDRFGRTPAHEAALQGKTGALQLLITAGADINVTSTSGDTPAHKAAYAGETGALQLLIDAGADVSLTDTFRDTPAHTAARAGKTGALQLLITAGADVNVASTSGETPAHKAVREGQTGALQLLITAGADINVASTSGRTPAHLAASWGKTGALQLLIDAGADVSLTDTFGDTALMLAAGRRGDNTQAVQLLLSAGGDTNHRNKQGNTVLMVAAGARPDNIDTVELLLSTGADINHRDKQGNTAQIIAVNSGNPNKADCLRKYTEKKLDMLLSLMEKFKEKDKINCQKLKEKDETIAEKDGKLTSKGQKLKEKDETIAEKDGKLTSKGQKLKEKDETIAEKDGKLTSKGKKLKEKNETIAKSEVKLHSKGKRIYECEEMLDEQGKLLKDKDRHLALKDNIIVQMENYQEDQAKKIKIGQYDNDVNYTQKQSLHATKADYKLTPTQSTFVLDEILPSICRIDMPGISGTGFVIGGVCDPITGILHRYVLTCYHVKVQDALRDQHPCVARFETALLPIFVNVLSPALFWNKDMDYVLVKLEPSPALEQLLVGKVALGQMVTVDDPVHNDALVLCAHMAEQLIDWGARAVCIDDVEVRRKHGDLSDINRRRQHSVPHHYPLTHKFMYYDCSCMAGTSGAPCLSAPQKRLYAMHCGSIYKERIEMEYGILLKCVVDDIASNIRNMASIPGASNMQQGGIWLNQLSQLFPLLSTIIYPDTAMQ